MKYFWQRIHSHRWPLALMGFAYLLVVLPLFSPDTTLAGMDVLEQELDYWSLLSQALAQGELPWWNPYLLCGTPHLATMNGGPLHPLHLILAFLFTPAFGIKLSVAINLLISMLGSYLLAIHLWGNPWSGLISALMYTLGGFSMMHLGAGHTSLIASYVLIPLVVLTWDRLLISGGLSRWLVAGLSLGILVLSGHAQVIALAFIGVALFIIIRLSVWRPEPALPRIRAIGWLVAGIFLGAMISGVQWIPALDFIQRSGRWSNMDMNFYSLGQMEPQALALLLAPTSVLNQPIHLLSWEICGFVGLSGLVLLIAGIFHFKRVDIILSGCLLLSIILTLGPVYQLLVKIIPGWGVFRVPGRFLGLASFWAALLAGSALRKPTIKQFILAVLFIAVFALLVGLKAAWINSSVFWWWAMIPLLLIILLLSMTVILSFDIKFVQGGLALLLAIELVLFAKPQLRVKPVPEPIPYSVVQQLKVHSNDFRTLLMPPLPMNMAVRVQSLTLGGYLPAAPERYRHYFALATGQPVQRQIVRFFSHVITPALANLGLGFVIAPAQAQPPSFLKPIQSEQGWILYEVKEAIPRARLIHRFVSATDAKQAITLAASGRIDLKQVAITEAPLPGKRSSDQKAAIDQVQWKDSSLNYFALQVRTQRPAMLVLADSYDPGWRAESSGRPLSIVPVDGVLMGVVLDRGEHQLRFYYEPAARKWGLAITASGMMLLIGFALFGIASRFISNRRPTSVPMN